MSHLKTNPTPRRSTHALRTLGAGTLLACIGLGSVGCEDVLKNVKAPDALLDRIDLLEAPSANKLARYACHEWVGNSSVCEATLGSKPKKSNMRFSFDVVFDLNNPNKNFPIPLVEMLLAMNVYPDDTNQDLGAVCVSFCDAGDSSCTPDADAQAACDLSSATQVDTVSDVVPSVDDMIELATDVANGETDNSYEFQYIPKGGSTEAHVQLDLNIDVMLTVMETLLFDAAEDALAGRNVNLKVPYESEGNVFFNAPELGRYAVGFGPFEDKWKL
jgi:hypothetical protein